jgi:hypothetical protein
VFQKRFAFQKCSAFLKDKKFLKQPAKYMAQHWLLWRETIIATQTKNIIGDKINQGPPGPRKKPNKHHKKLPEENLTIQPSSVHSRETSKWKTTKRPSSIKNWQTTKFQAYRKANKQTTEFKANK